MKRLRRPDSNGAAGEEGDGGVGAVALCILGVTALGEKVGVAPHPQFLLLGRGL